MHEQQLSTANNLTMLSSILKSTKQIENISEINDEFTEFVKTTNHYRDVSNDTISLQNFTINNC